MIYFPRVVGMTDSSFQRTINESIEHQVHQMIATQETNMSSPVEEMDGYFEIKNNQCQVLSLTQTNYTYHRHAAHGLTILRSLTFDLIEKRTCTLRDLFKPGSNYVKRLSDIVHQQIKTRDIPLIEEFDSIKPNQSYYLADKCLVLYFQVYELTAYVYGFPMFPISIYEVSDIIREDGPLGRLSENN
ncbi:DUF3298 domain-containing protein [Paenisporosarcina cavernae]|uniref:DUF3298 domain-containing protein n=1 Tax=Paenisporosarcina cavernae TaxID=2320858 RepID=A0A385YVL5_9BACL|nr:DUF3298 domain-containing protein [Paenisporosarcina cavernae]